MAKIKGNFLTFSGVTNVTDCITAEEVLNKAGLNWNVAKAKMFAQMPGKVDYDGDGYYNPTDFFHGSKSFKVLDNAFCTYRTDKNIPLGLVKERYTPVQNRDIFKFFDDAIGKNKAEWFTAGCKDNGNKVFISAKIDSSLLINGKDEIQNYLVFSTSHDGSSGIKIVLTPIRTICFNCMNAAIRNASSMITLKHTKNVHQNVHQGIEILDIARQKIKSFGEEMEAMCKIQMSDKEAYEIFGNVILSKDELKTLANNGYTVEDLAYKNISCINNCQISMTKANMMKDMVDYYHIGAGQRQYLGTGYGVYNAVNGYYSNVANDEGYKRMENLISGTASNKIKLASDLILN